jgi:hypothetical protein
VSDLGDIGNYATFDERRGVLTLHYKEGSRSTVETVQVGDLIDAGTLVLARGWHFTADRWGYSTLDGHTIGITREER